MVIKVRFDHPSRMEVKPDVQTKEFVVGHIKSYYISYGSRVDEQYAHSTLARPQEFYEKLIFDVEHADDEFKRLGHWCYTSIDATDFYENSISILFNTMAFIENEEGKTIDKIVV